MNGQFPGLQMWTICTRVGGPPHYNRPRTTGNGYMIQPRIISDKNIRASDLFNNPLKPQVNGNKVILRTQGYQRFKILPFIRRA